MSNSLEKCICGNVKEVNRTVHDIECKLSPAHEREREKHHKGAINFSVKKSRENFLCIFFLFPILFIFIAIEKHKKMPIFYGKTHTRWTKLNCGNYKWERKKVITAIVFDFWPKSRIFFLFRDYASSKNKVTLTSVLIFFLSPLDDDALATRFFNIIVVCRNWEKRKRWRVGKLVHKPVDFLSFFRWRKYLLTSDDVCLLIKYKWEIFWVS